MDLFRRPARRRPRPIQHDPLRLSREMHNLEFLPTPSRKIHKFGLARLKRMRGPVRSGESIKLPRFDGLFAEPSRCVVEDDLGVGSRFDDVEPFVFGAVPVWDGRGVLWGDGYEVDTSLTETAWIAEIELILLDGVVQRMGVDLGDVGGISGLDPVRVRTVHGGWLARWDWMCSRQGVQ